MPDYIIEAKPSIIDLDKRMFLRIVLTGLGIGFGVWGLAFLLDNFIIKAWFCSDANSVACQSSAIYSGNISAVIMSVVGISVLVRLGVFRPLLIILASLITLWGLAGWLASVSVLESLGWTMVLYTLSFVTYAWLARIRKAFIMIVLVTIVVIATRLIPTLL